MYKKTVLDNGLKIIAHPMSGRQSLALGIWINVGGRYETSSNKGTSHFLEHLVFKGTKKFSCNKIKESIEGIGGSLNGFTSEELTCYFVKVPAGYLELALDVLSDMVVNPSLPAAEIEKEKGVVLEEIKMYKDLPQSYVYELLDELLWPGQALGMPIIGTAESVSQMTRDKLHSFKHKFYTPSSIVISAAGLLNYKKLETILKRTFLSLKKQEIETYPLAREGQTVAQLKVFDKDTEQTHMALGFHALSREHPLKHALTLLHIILGANMSSRLFNELREKRGLAYDIGTSFKRLQDTGCFIVHAGIDNQKVDEAISLVLKELKKLKANLVTSDEFRRAKEYYLGQLGLALEDTLDNMLWIGETTATLDKVYSLDDIVKEVNKVRREHIREVARRIFTEKKLNLAIIGPLKDSEKSIYNELRLN